MTNIIYGTDLNDQFFFWKSFLAENIKQGIIPFWNPYSFSGTPFLAHPSTAAFYPFNIIFLILPLPFAFSAYLLIHIILAGIFMYWLCRKYADKISSLAGSVIFSLSGLMAARIYSGHVDIISTLIWVPAVFGSVINALATKKKKDILLAIIFLTLQILAGYMAVVVFILELILIYQVVMWILCHCDPPAGGEAIFKDRHVPIESGLAMTNGIKTFLTLIFIIIISFGISAVQLLPTIEFVRNSIRGGGLPYEMLTWGSYTLDQFIMFINPFKYGSPFPENYTYNGPGPNFFEISYFTGVIPLLLFISYIIYNLYKVFVNKKKEGEFFGLLAALIFFSLVSLGNNFLLHPALYKLIPFYRLFRFPSQHLMMAVFIIALISSFAVAKVKNRALQIIIVLAVVFELLNYDKKFIRFSSLPADNFDTQLIETLTKDKELVRVLPDYSVVSAARKSWDFESSMYYKIHSTSGYNPILLANYYNFIDILNKNYSSSITQYNVEIPPPDPSSKDIDFLNVKYVLMDKNYDAIKNKSLDKYSLLKEGDSYRLYENKSYMPRFFVKCTDESVEKVEVVDYQLSNIRLKTNSDCDGVLSSSEVYYPGWKAKIDNKETSIIKNNTAFRSIFLPKGEHEVIFYYEPTIYYIGGLISLITLLFTAYILRSESFLRKQESSSYKNMDPASSAG